MAGVRVPQGVARVAATVRPGGPPGQGPLLLELDLTGGLATAPPPDLLGRVQAARGLTLTGVVRRLAEAEDDPAVVGLVAKLGGGRLRLAQAQEVAAAVRSFREAGKRTWAWAETFGELGPGTPGYTLATAFDEIWLQPSGDVGLTGVAVRGPVPARGARSGRHRAAVRPALRVQERRRPPAAARVHTGASGGERAAGGLRPRPGGHPGGRRTGLAPDAVRELVDRAPLSAAEALEARLVDRLGYREEVYAAAREATGDGVRLRYLAAYRRHRAPAERARETLRRRVAHRRAGVVALIHAAGEIRLGRSGRGLQGPALGSDSLDRRPAGRGGRRPGRAVVLRVDSPGGSYVASDAVWGAVTALKATGRPVVVSMGTWRGRAGTSSPARRT